MVRHTALMQIKNTRTAFDRAAVSQGISPEWHEHVYFFVLRRLTYTAARKCLNATCLCMQGSEGSSAHQFAGRTFTFNAASKLRAKPSRSAARGVARCGLDSALLLQARSFERRSKGAEHKGVMSGGMGMVWEKLRALCMACVPDAMLLFIY